VQIHHGMTEDVLIRPASRDDTPSSNPETSPGQDLGL